MFFLSTLSLISLEYYPCNVLRYTNAFYSRSTVNQSNVEFAIANRRQHDSGSNAIMLGLAPF
jgi:hypothetical protein